jgi:hypothetical protein
MERTRYDRGAYDVFLLRKVAATMISLLMAALTSDLDRSS